MDGKYKGNLVAHFKVRIAHHLRSAFCIHTDSSVILAQMAYYRPKLAIMVGISNRASH